MSDSIQEVIVRPAKRICAIDLGTNSFHGIIVDIYSDGSFRTIDQIKEMVRLGRKGVGVAFARDTMDSGIEVLQKIKQLAEGHQCEKILAYATSAIREAPNGGDFIQRSIDEVGIKIRAIPGKTEAELIGLAVQHGMALDENPVMIMDIGGGSTEFILANNLNLLFLDSYKLGVSRMTTDFISNDPVSKKEVKALKEFYRDKFQTLAEIHKKHPAKVLIGSSGTLENIAAMIAARKQQSTELTLNEFEYSAGDFSEFYSYFITLNSAKRLKQQGLDEKRVDFIVAGLILLDTVIEMFGIEKVRTSTQALREGIILRYIRKEKLGLKFMGTYPDSRRRSVFELLSKCNWQETHSSHVARLALSLFDQTKAYHNLSDNDRELLEFAAYLHDIGYHISHKKHHKHSLYIIQHSDLKGFKEEEIQIMAHVSRYHRRSTPKNRHALYNQLPDDVKSKIRKLSGILRVADGLDRSHFQNVIDVQLSAGKNKMKLLIDSQIDPDLEIWGAMRKRELFEEMLGMKLKIKPLKED